MFTFENKASWSGYCVRSEKVKSKQKTLMAVEVGKRFPFYSSSKVTLRKYSTVNCIYFTSHFISSVSAAEVDILA